MNKIKLTFWNKPNFGDVLSPYLINKLSGKKIQYKSSYTSWENAFRNVLHYIKCGQFSKISSVTFPCEHVLLSIGSILSYSDKNAIVWGSGFMAADEPFKGGNVLAVRGKFSNEKLKKMGYKGCNVFGDPALLVPIVYPASKTSQHKIGIIPHWKEVDFFKKAYSDKYLIIDLRTTDVESVIDEIVSCQYILSTSLHGIIVSHAYGVPALWIEKGNIDTDGIKFKDYLSSVGIDLYDGFKNYEEILSESFNIEKFFEDHKEIAITKIDISKIQKSLLSVAPFNVLENYKL